MGKRHTTYRHHGKKTTPTIQNDVKIMNAGSECWIRVGEEEHQQNGIIKTNLSRQQMGALRAKLVRSSREANQRQLRWLAKVFGGEYFE